MVTLASPLLPDTPLTLVTPLAFSFSDGVQTITALNSSGPTFFFATGFDGTITQWTAFASTHAPFASIFTKSSTEPGNTFDEGFMTELSGFASNLNSPGTWTRLAPTPVTDAVSSLALLSLSLTALGVAARQFKRAAA
jgi:hypothetical protein